ncbi:MAG: hypothetical protein GWN00_20875, partial [Aliifodinibius sp.]|nr:hypothetical protein [Fodinibius sp.]NIW97121.1 hypothetical protein [Phycisphaerae bacterium]NIY27173.1 hypothetical protein [Fodinibius sp.]
MLYTRIAQNLSSGSHTDTTAFNSGLGYVVVPRSGNTRGPHSPEVNDLPEPPQNAKLTLYRLNPLQVKVAWQPPSGAVNFRYRVYRS